jgi:hypothetical protein
MGCFIQLNHHRRANVILRNDIQNKKAETATFLGTKKTPAVRRGSDTDQQGLQSFGIKTT